MLITLWSWSGTRTSHRSSSTLLFFALSHPRRFSLAAIVYAVPYVPFVKYASSMRPLSPQHVLQNEDNEDGSIECTAYDCLRTNIDDHLSEQEAWDAYQKDLVTKYKSEDVTGARQIPCEKQLHNVSNPPSRKSTEWRRVRSCRPLL